jgi:hypothetical protein
VGKQSPEGSEYTAANAYRYRKQGGKWRLLHHIIMEEKLGRPLEKGERVFFKDGNRENLDPDNIDCRPIMTSKAKRIRQLEDRIEELQTELDQLRKSS